MHAWARPPWRWRPALGALALLVALAWWLGREPRESAPTSARAGVARRPSPRLAGPAVAPGLFVEGQVRGPEGGLAGALVCAGAGGRGGGLAAPTCARATEGGRFRVELGAGSYRLWASAPGHVPAPDQVGGVPVVVSPEGPPPDPILRLVPGGQPVAGVVRDALGGPVEGAWIALADRDGDVPVTATASDVAGRFRLWAAPHPHTLRVRAEGYAGEALRVDVPQEDLVVNLLPEAVIEAHVLPPRGRSGLGVWVSLHPDGSPFEILARAATDAEGRARLSGLAAGTHVVEARGPGLCTPAPPLLSLAAGQTAKIEVPTEPCPSLRVRVTLAHRGEPCPAPEVLLIALGGALDTVGQSGPGEVVFEGLAPGPYRAQITCPGARGQEITRRVETEPAEQVWDVRLEPSGAGVIEGIVRGPAGDGVAGAEVWARGEGGELHGHALAGPGGHFRMEGVAAASLRIRAQSPTGLASDEIELNLAPTERTHVTLTLQEGATFEGRVVSDESGEPLPGAWVELHRDGAHAAARADEAGRVRLSGLAGDRPYEVRVLGHLVLEPQALELEAGRVVSREIRVRTTRCDLALRVVDGAGDGVAEATVTATAPETPSLRALTGPDGRARIEGALDTTYAVEARDGEGRVAQGRLSPCEGGRHTLELPLVGQVRGRVLDPDGYPAPHARIGLRSEASPRTRHAYADAQGRFAATGIPAGAEIVMGAQAPTGRAEVTLAPLTPGEAREVVLRLRATVTARGRVVTGDGRPVPRAWVVPQIPGGGARDALGPGLANLTGEAGTFQLSGVPPGELELMVTAPGHRAGFVRAHVPATPPHDLGTIRVAPDAPPRRLELDTQPAPE